MADSIDDGKRVQTLSDLCVNEKRSTRFPQGCDVRRARHPGLLRLVSDIRPMGGAFLPIVRYRIDIPQTKRRMCSVVPQLGSPRQSDLFEAQ